jgi:hypothetical protein
MNMRCTSSGITPLHDAIELGDKEKVKYLMQCGANVMLRRSDGLGAVDSSIATENKNVLKYLINAGADMNASQSAVSALCRIAEAPDRDMKAIAMDYITKEFLNDLYPASSHCGLRTTVVDLAKEISPILYGIDPECEVLSPSSLYDCGVIQNTDLVETLLQCGSNISTTTDIQLILSKVLQRLEDFLEYARGPHYFLHKGSDEPVDDIIVKAEWLKCELRLAASSQHAGLLQFLLGMCSVHWLISWPSPLHYACAYGQVDTVRMLLIAGADASTRDMHGRTPLDILRLASNNYYHVLEEAVACENVVESFGSGCTPVIRCPSMVSLLYTLGLGDIQYIQDSESRDLKVLVREVLRNLISCCDAFSKAELTPVGSSAEGTKVGWQDEMDFLVELDMCVDASDVRDAGFDYAYYSKESIFVLRGSKRFHSVFQREIGEAANSCCFSHQSANFRNLYMQPELTVCVKDCNRRATSTLTILHCSAETGTIISVDAVPCLHVNDWPERCIEATWLLDHESLRRHGYVLVPKSPHKDSELAKMYSDTQLRSMWKISFAHLETYHMQHLEQRVKDVYVLAKCLRNPDVCRILVMSDQQKGPAMVSLPKNMDKYVSSYMLKMVFFKNVRYFLESDLSLGEMVCRVYDELEEGLSQGFIPLYFMPTASALGGHKLDVRKSAKVAALMKRFVHALFLRDSQVDQSVADADEEIIVYQRQPTSVYRSVDIS